MHIVRVGVVLTTVYASMFFISVLLPIYSVCSVLLESLQAASLQATSFHLACRVSVPLLAVAGIPLRKGYELPKYVRGSENKAIIHRMCLTRDLKQPHISTHIIAHMILPM